VETQVSLDADLLDRARARHVDLSATLETTLRKLLDRDREAAWRAENAGAIEDAHVFLERHGLWSDGKRGF
jgi:antitoxin CcdA